MTQKNIILIRHAESQANAGGVTLTPESIELTKRGHQQAQSLAASQEDVARLNIETFALRPTMLAFTLLPFYHVLNKMQSKIDLEMNHVRCY